MVRLPNGDRWSSQILAKQLRCWHLAFHAPAITARQDESTDPLTAHGKLVVTRMMYQDGRDFLGAAMLLSQRREGSDAVVLHLTCQGIEIILKAFLLVADYDRFKPRLRSMGYNLVRLAQEVTKVAKVKPLRSNVLAELQALNNFYTRHLLRYASADRIFIDYGTWIAIASSGGRWQSSRLWTRSILSFEHSHFSGERSPRSWYQLCRSPAES